MHGVDQRGIIETPSTVLPAEHIAAPVFPSGNGTGTAHIRSLKRRYPNQCLYNRTNARPNELDC
jgi:hypothetical protein